MTSGAAAQSFSEYMGSRPDPPPLPPAPSATDEAQRRLEDSAAVGLVVGVAGLVVAGPVLGIAAGAGAAGVAASNERRAGHLARGVGAAGRRGAAAVSGAVAPAVVRLARSGAAASQAAVGGLGSLDAKLGVRERLKRAAHQVRWRGSPRAGPRPSRFSCLSGLPPIKH